MVSRRDRGSDLEPGVLSVFHEPWWLDAAAPGGWAEVQVAENGRPAARWPFAEQRRYGLRLLLAPPLSARLGPMVEPVEARYETNIRRFDHLVDGLIDQLPPADLFRQALHPDIPSWLPFYRRGFQVEPQISYALDLDDLDEVWNGMSGQTRRVIRKAGNELEIHRDTTPDRLEHMVRCTFGRQSLEVPYDPSALTRIARTSLARDRGVVLSAVDESGVVHASLFGAWDDRRAWYICGGGDPGLRSSGGGSLLMWELIRESAKRVARLDFEGSMLPNVERYFRNFGGRQETYFLVTRTSRRFGPLWALWQKQTRASARDGAGRPARRRLLGKAATRMTARTTDARSSACLRDRLGAPLTSRAAGPSWTAEISPQSPA